MKNLLPFLLILTLSTSHAQESAYVKNLLNVTLTEYNQYANYKETDPVLCKQIQNYWAVVGNTSAKCNDDFPWSAVFISYCVKQAGATSSEFLFAESHAAFVKQAIANADKNVGVFRAVPVASYVPKLGDIVQKNRYNKAKKKYSFEEARKMDDYKSHSAIVVDFKKNLFGKHAVTIGGNERDSIRKAKVKLTKKGFIKQKGRYPYISVIKVLK